MPRRIGAGRGAGPWGLWGRRGRRRFWPKLLVALVLIGLGLWLAAERGDLDLPGGNAAAGPAGGAPAGASRGGGPGAAADPGPPRPERAARFAVVSVHDGDTLRLRPDGGGADWVAAAGRESTRLLGIDAPETGDRAECFGNRATAALRRVAPPGSTVWGAPDREPRDQYGRVLLHLWTGDGRFVQEQLVASGAAEVEYYEPNTRYVSVLLRAEGEARARGAGQWGACR